MKKTLLLIISCSIGTLFGSVTAVLSGVTFNISEYFRHEIYLIVLFPTLLFGGLIYLSRNYLIRQKIKFLNQLEEMVEKKITSISNDKCNIVEDEKPCSTIIFPSLMVSNATNNREIIIEKVSNISDQKCDEIAEKLIAYMKEKKPYLNADLRQVDVVAALGYSMREVSTVLNAKLNQNFSDFVNSYRVDEIKSRITNNQLEKYTLTAIALECGFSAKTSFHRAFKKATSMTPTEYFKEMNVVTEKTICFETQSEIPTNSHNYRIRIPNKNIALL